MKILPFFSRLSEKDNSGHADTTNVLGLVTLQNGSCANTFSNLLHAMTFMEWRAVLLASRALLG